MALAPGKTARYILRSFSTVIIDIMRRPKPVKTRKSVAKRFKITATGKVKSPRAGRRHLLQGKSPKRRRALGKARMLNTVDACRVIANLPFSH